MKGGGSVHGSHADTQLALSRVTARDRSQGRELPRESGRVLQVLWPDLPSSGQGASCWPGLVTPSVGGKVCTARDGCQRVCSEQRQP